MVFSVCARARRTAGAAMDGRSRIRAPVAGVNGTQLCVCKSFLDVSDSGPEANCRLSGWGRGPKSAKILKLGSDCVHGIRFDHRNYLGR